ncbi:MAG: dCTP deaminase [Candidatus Thermoplasmatota archaeon]|nr:dCTP deaminase [Candidatus Thermoplasmatota archaeon]
MAVLSDATIQRLIKQGTLAIQPFQAEDLTPNGVDLRIGEVLLPEVEGGPVKVEEGTATIPGRERFLISTQEVVTLGEEIAGQLWIRSTYARKGVLAAFGKVEAGFSGTLTIGCFNASKQPLELPIGERFCQLAFEAMTEAAEALYEERSGTYQGQRGVTLAPDSS